MRFVVSKRKYVVDLGYTRNTRDNGGGVREENSTVVGVSGKPQARAHILSTMCYFGVIHDQRTTQCVESAQTHLLNCSGFLFGSAALSSELGS